MAVHSQNMKYIKITPPAAIVDNASFATVSIDTTGWDYLTIVCYLGATDIAMTALKVQESDTDGSYADVTGLIFGTSTDIAGDASTLPSATNDNNFFVFDIDLRNRKKFLDVVATMGDGTVGGFMSIIGILSRGDTAPTSITERGAIGLVRK